MSIIGNVRRFNRWVLPPSWWAILLVWPAVSKADYTNGVFPVVGVQTLSHTTESGSPSGLFSVQRTGDTSQALEVNYSVSGTATNGVDYQRLSGVVTIPAGQSTAQIAVTPINHYQEGDSPNVTLTLVATQPALHHRGAAGHPVLHPGGQWRHARLFSRPKPNGSRTTGTHRTSCSSCTKATSPTGTPRGNGRMPGPA